eukprot:CAMPEP_0114992574 /NCGR_PEP_ID=MMETSP0216-20121206/12019_1 /TAXON_ID=223996 /ORGANISM="Protocruzia adherens, Strain Boccale" /LENGTH=414 /DNA_ID=CAMNT_0002356059 /DNA_START=31 /DNA_END=1275 /DNA_ORIENTATION=+
MANKKSKKGKKNWRKNTDVKDAVESFNKEKHLKTLEREVETAPMESLFTIDVTGNAKKRAPLDPERFKQKKNHFLSKHQQKLVKKIEKARKEAKPAVPKKTKEDIFDAWEDEEANKPKTHRQIKLNRVRHQRESAAPAVTVPLPGQSYNPSNDDHEDLMQLAACEEVKREQERLRVLQDLQPRKFKAHDQVEGDESEGYSEDSSDEEAEENEGNDNEEEADVIPKGVDADLQRLTKDQLRKKQSKNIRDKLEKQVNQEKTLSKQIGQVGSILKDMKKDERDRKTKKDEINRIKDLELEKEKMGYLSKPKKMGKYAYNPKPVDLQLGDDLSSSLRGVKRVGDVVTDHFDGLYKRGLLEQKNANKKKKKDFKNNKKFKFHQKWGSKATEMHEERKKRKVEEAKQKDTEMIAIEGEL